MDLMLRAWILDLDLNFGAYQIIPTSYLAISDLALSEH